MNTSNSFAVFVMHVTVTRNYMCMGNVLRAKRL